MGIPILFNFFKFNCKCLCYDIKQCPEIDNLFLDLNFLVYQSFRELNYIKEINITDNHYQCALFKRFFQIIIDILDYVKPKKRIYFTFDGSSPRAKFKTQLSRRIDYLEKIDYNSNSNIKFTSCLVSPGTQMMNELNDKFNLFITEFLLKNKQYANNSIYYSGFKENGEGEFKIFKFIKDLNISNERNMIVGRDTDFVIYALANDLFNLRILSYFKTTNLSNDKFNNSEKFKLNCLNDNLECDNMILIDNKTEKLNYQVFEHLEVRKVYDYLMSMFSDIVNLNLNHLIRDIILIFILLGTDYTISMPYLYKIVDPLKLLLKYHYYLRNNNFAFLTNEDGLNLINLKKFIDLLNKHLFSKFKSNQNLKFIKLEFYKREMNIKNGKPNKNVLKILTTNYLLALFYNLKIYYTDILSWDFTMKKLPPFLDDMIIDETIDFNQLRDKSLPLLPLVNLVHITPYQYFDVLLPIAYQDSLKNILNKPERNHIVEKCFYYNLIINKNIRREKYYDKINKIINELDDKLNQNEKLRNGQDSVKLFITCN